MNKESFLDTLRTQYREDIREAFIECEHQSQVDFLTLNIKLKSLMNTAKFEGLPFKDFEDLVNSTLPEGIVKGVDIFLTLPAFVKKAA